MQEKKSTIFERMMHIASKAGYKNISELAKALNYKSPEKLYRLERNKNAKPSIDIIADFANKFAKENIYWLITGKDIKSEEEKLDALFINTTFNLKEHTGLDEETPIHLSKNKNEDFLFVNRNEIFIYPSFYSSTDFLNALQQIKIPELENGLYRAFRVNDSNMNPTIHKNAIAVGYWVETTNHLTNHNIYIIVTRSHGYYNESYKYLFKQKRIVFSF